MLCAGYIARQKKRTWTRASWKPSKSSDHWAIRFYPATSTFNLKIAKSFEWILYGYFVLPEIISYWQKQRPKVRLSSKVFLAFSWSFLIWIKRKAILNSMNWLSRIFTTTMNSIYLLLNNLLVNVMLTNKLLNSK